MLLNARGLQARLRSYGEVISPQTYFQENRNSSNDPHLRLDQSGTSLVLECGASLFFPLQSTSNLPIMLTESMLHGSKGTNFTSFMAGNTVFQPTQSTSNFPKYPRISPGILPYLINHLNLDNTTITALPKFIDRNILSKRNWNLNPSQKELLLWHQRLGHADLSRVHAMLSKPRTSTRDEHRR